MQKSLCIILMFKYLFHHFFCTLHQCFGGDTVLLHKAVIRCRLTEGILNADFCNLNGALLGKDLTYHGKQ